MGVRAAAEHHGQHRRCRSCGTNPRALVSAAQAAARRRPRPAGAATAPRAAGGALGAAACQLCGGAGWTDVHPVTGELLAGVVPCPCREGQR